jgi:hypothetical protein
MERSGNASVGVAKLFQELETQRNGPRATLRTIRTDCRRLDTRRCARCEASKASAGHVQSTSRASTSRSLGREPLGESFRIDAERVAGAHFGAAETLEGPPGVSSLDFSDG